MSLWMAIIFYPDDELKIIACDVGQGDATLLMLGKFNVLIDGGPDSSVISCLDRYMPFWDRQVESVLLTHPQKDHFVGLIEVFKRYTVGQLLVSELDSDTQEYRLLEELVGGSNTSVIRPKKGMKIRMGLIYIDILHPSGSFNTLNSEEKITSSSNKVLGSIESGRNANDFSIVTHLRYHDFDALFTGDIGPDVIDEMISDVEDVEYLKVPHHGSKNGLTSELLERSSPEIAVISSGKNNPHGHPHQEVIDLLTGRGVRVYRTDQVGDVVITTDGYKISIN